MNQENRRGPVIAAFLSAGDGMTPEPVCRLINAIADIWPFAFIHIFATFSEETLRRWMKAGFTYHWYPEAVHRQLHLPGVEQAALHNCPVCGGQDSGLHPAGGIAGLLSESSCLTVISDVSGWGVDAAEKLGIPWAVLDQEGVFASDRTLRHALIQSCPSGKIEGEGGAAEILCRYLVDRWELLDLVTPDGETIGALPRSLVHGNTHLLHKVVHVLVFDRMGRLLLQKRSASKRVAPGKWDTSVGGHVDCGEGVRSAMEREMAEELGLAATKAVYAYRYLHSNPFESELVYTFLCRADQTVVFNPEEIEAVRFWTLEEIQACLGKAVFSDNFEHEFSLLLNWKKT